MIHVPLTLRETNLSNSTIETLKVSIPFAQRALLNPDKLSLVNKADETYPFQPLVLAYWPDKSIKWLQVSFHYTPLQGDASPLLYLTDQTATKKLSASTLNQKNIKIEHKAEKLVIDTSHSTFVINKKMLGSFIPQTNSKALDAANNTSTYQSDDHSLVLTDNKDVQYFPKISHVNIITNNVINLTTIIEFSGSFTSKQGHDLLNFCADIQFFSGSGKTKWRITLHNPKGIVHNNGKWDLGNQNSVTFNSFNAFVSNTGIQSLNFKINKNSPWQQSETAQFELFQASSGGINWQSNNHVNSDGLVNIPFNGYSLRVNNTESKVEGRAQPLLILNTTKHSICIDVDNFWQNFPKKIAVNDSAIAIGLFPDQKHSFYELQPGEKKSHTFSIDYSAAVSDNDSPLQTNTSSIEIIVDKNYIATTQVIPFFSDKTDDNELSEIIKKGLTGHNNFFNKREVIDEFGWRNFGDLYADHEALEYKGDSELVSHYNNQYDPLYGFLRQYLSTGEYQWLQLANDLAAHVKDIDIYHTTKDRAEYNGGLFWHTDHYLPAETASHRTYSERQTANAYQDHAGGGGPGGQHCYTTGLMLHYFLTGDKTSKKAAITLTKWITNVYEGSQTFTDLLLAIKNKNRIDLKNIFTGKYPLDRGTGHYITALIDAFELSGKQSYLDQASLVIKHTVHPCDDINDRDLLNVEVCWYYTVFFQAVYRFLQVKEHNSQIDSSFEYAKSTLLHYSMWMLKHEAPYLDKPEILEYPNHTWAAQDIRKANVLFFAAYYAETEIDKEALFNKANLFYQYVTRELKSEPTSDTTRILSILMQNYGIRSYCLNNSSTNINKVNAEYVKTEKSTKQNILEAFSQTLNNTSLAREIDWLRKRVAKVDAFLIKLGR